MTATILDGKATLATIKDELRVRVKALADRGVVPGLGTILVGDDPGSHAYVAGKHRDCAELGIASIRRDLPADRHPGRRSRRGGRAERRPGLRRLHRPAAAAEGPGRAAVLEPSTRPRTPTACTRSTSAGSCWARPAPLPCTPRGIVELLRRYDVPIAGAEVVVVGRGTTVGRPLGLLLTRRSENATVTLCHTGTRDLAAHVRAADIVVAAAGVPGLITADDGQAGRGRARRRHLPGGTRRRQDEARRRRRAGRAPRSPGIWRRCPAASA